MSSRSTGLIISAGVALAVFGIIYTVLFAPRPPDPAKVIEAHQEQQQGQAKTLQDTNRVVTTNTQTTRKIDVQTQENRRAITSSPGATQAATDAVDTAGRRAICMRKSAADLPECQRLRLPSP